ncbi:transmembrane protein 141 isoform X3 [Fukomys damarensis]|uniref:transmembrane protein 141 isoform X3 n=1 Tax=Fukomys damarensis TaxID=885580 RepID=UPI00053F312C|nr:transmembrane protein 141 isoform X3 [Fukomys damarensis]
MMQWPPSTRHRRDLRPADSHPEKVSLPDAVEYPGGRGSVPIGELQPGCGSGWKESRNTVLRAPNSRPPHTPRGLTNLLLLLLLLPPTPRTCPGRREPGI